MNTKIGGIKIICKYESERYLCRAENAYLKMFSPIAATVCRNSLLQRLYLRLKWQQWRIMEIISFFTVLQFSYCLILSILLGMKENLEIKYLMKLYRLINWTISIIQNWVRCINNRVSEIFWILLIISLLKSPFLWCIYQNVLRTMLVNESWKLWKSTGFVRSTEIDIIYK